jgi:hypothetical protein
MSRQDQEFEVARRVVRLAGESVKQATRMPPVGPPTTIAKNAVLAAATRHAPGLAGRAAAKSGGCACGKRPQGGGRPGYRPQRPQRGPQRGRPPRGPGYGPASAPSGGFGGAPSYGGEPADGGGYGDGIETGGGYAPAGNGNGGGYGAPGYGAPQGPSRGFARSGSWFRRGNTVVLTPGT